MIFAAPYREFLTAREGCILVAGAMKGSAKPSGQNVERHDRQHDDSHDYNRYWVNCL
jgi:hypothetical protein